MSWSLRIRKILTWIILTVSAVIFVGAMAFLALQISGRRRLEQKTCGTVPCLSGTEPVEAGVLSEDWQEGDVLYQGVHYRYNSDILTFLFFGIDRREEAGDAKTDVGRADAVFLLVLDPHTKEMSVIGVDRNTVADVDVYDRDGAFVATEKLPLCLQYTYGDGLHVSCERSEAAVSGLFYELPINGYAAVNMGAIPMINATVGGVRVTALEDLAESGIRKGEEVLLDDRSSYAYLHDRDEQMPGSARLRLQRQLQYVTAYCETALASLKENPALPIELFRVLEKYMVTDISVDEVSYLATQVADYTFNEQMIYLPEGETLQTEDSVRDTSGEVFYPDETSLYEMMLKVFYEEVKK